MICELKEIMMMREEILKKYRNYISNNKIIIASG